MKHSNGLLDTNGKFNHITQMPMILLVLSDQTSSIFVSPPKIKHFLHSFK